MSYRCARACVCADCVEMLSHLCVCVCVNQIVKKTVKEEKKDSDYGDKAQAHWDKYKKKKKALKS